MPPKLYKESRIGKETNKEERKYDTLHTQLTMVWKPRSVVFIFVVCYSADQQSALLQTVYVRHIRIHCAQSGSFPRQSFFSAGFINLYLLLYHLYLTYTFHTQTRLSPHLRSSENLTQRWTVDQLRDLCILFKCVPIGGLSPGYIGRSLKLIAQFLRQEGFWKCLELCLHFHVFSTARCSNTWASSAVY